MPVGTRSRVALLALMAVLLIPVGMSSLRGLTHILTCEELIPTPFTLVVPDEGPPTILSSLALEAGGEEGLCGGLVTDIRVGPTAENDARVTLLVSNQTDFAWRGTVQLRLRGATIPVDISRISPGTTAKDSVVVRLKPGENEIDGGLLVGP